jgi:hypothetical protein
MVKKKSPTQRNYKVSDQIQNRVFNRPLAHKAKLELVKSRLSSVQTQ